MTAAASLVHCNRVISSSGNVLAIWPLSIFWRKSFRLCLPLSDRSVTYLSSSFTQEMQVFGWYSWQTNFLITATALDVGCAVVPRSASAINGISFSFKNGFQQASFPLPAKLLGIVSFPIHCSTVFVFKENAPSDLIIVTFTTDSD